MNADRSGRVGGERPIVSNTLNSRREGIVGNEQRSTAISSSSSSSSATTSVNSNPIRGNVNATSSQIPLTTGSIYPPNTRTKSPRRQGNSTSSNLENVISQHGDVMKVLKLNIDSAFIDKEDQLIDNIDEKERQYEQHGLLVVREDLKDVKGK